MLLCSLTFSGPAKSLYMISLESLFMFHLNLILHTYIIEKILSITITRNICGFGYTKDHESTDVLEHPK